MIISASYRTDIPAFYAEWFENRLNAGFVQVKNPYGGPPTMVSLANGDVDGYVFWTRNARRFWSVLNRISDANIPFIIQYTITGYPRCLDTGTLSAKRAAADVHGLASRFGRKSVVWRYDPIVFSSVTEPAWHIANFARLCETLASAVDEVVVSVAHIYRKTARNLNKAARIEGFNWYDPNLEEKTILLRQLTDIAAEKGLRFSVCGQLEFIGSGINEARCIDADRLADIAGRQIAVSDKPHRSGCRCYASRDIGAYDTCPHGCVYCYAVNSNRRAKQLFNSHDTAASGLAFSGDSNSSATGGLVNTTSSAKR